VIPSLRAVAKGLRWVVLAPSVGYDYIRCRGSRALGFAAPVSVVCVFMAATPPSRAKPPPPGRAAPNGPRVFISHSSKNQQLAAAVAAELEGNGIRCWMAPRDIRPGEPNYGKAIIEGLSACQATVLLLTEPSNRSQHVMKEAERAVNKNIPILIVKFQPIEVSKELEYYVSSAQFLDASAPPLQQHLRPLRHRVRDMLALAKAGGTPASIAIDLRPRPPRARSRWKQKLVGVAMLGGMLWGGWILAVPAIQGFLANLTVAVSRNTGGSESGASRQKRADYPAEPVQVTSNRSQYDASEDPRPPAAANNSLLAGVEAKTKVNNALAAFARSRLANFHREALLVTKVGEPEAGTVSESDVEVMASCQIQPNMKGYLALAKEFIELLEKRAQQQGVITSDGLRTSEQNGRDARPYLKEIAAGTLTDWSGLLGIFASDVHQRMVNQHATAGQCRYVSFPTVFLIYDEQVTADYRCGVYKLAWQRWNNLLQQQGTCIVVLLDSAKNSFRHTTWRWFHLAASDCATIAPYVPMTCRIAFTLTDSAGGKVESDYYSLKQFGVGRVDNDEILSLAPFFVNDDFEHYIPEVTLTKSVVVLKNDVRRVKDFAVTVDDVLKGGEAGD
jgi:hypothetical protein